ncbi:MAG: formate--tetrahydrofolate ligase [Candidatus Firestonebacteria bacterium]
MKSAIEVASKIGLRKKDLEVNGKYSAKLGFSLLSKLKTTGQGKLIVVTGTQHVKGAVSNNCALCDGLVEAFGLLRKKTSLCLPGFTVDSIIREYFNPNVYPVEDVLFRSQELNNILQAHNLISAYLSNISVLDGNSETGQFNISWNRASAFADESLTGILTGMNNHKPNRFLKEEKFEHILNSEITAVAALSLSFEELKSSLEKITVGQNKHGAPLHIRDLKLEDVLAAMLSDNLKPNLMQTNQGDPVFTNISASAAALPPGNLSAIKTALSLSEYVVVKLECSVDLSLEKFMNITLRDTGIKPDMIVLNTFVNELNYYGGAEREKMFEKNMPELEKGIQVLLRNIESAKKFGVPVLLNVSEQREVTKDEIKLIDKYCSNLGVKVGYTPARNSTVKHGIELVKNVLEIMRSQKSYYKPIYELDLTVKEKVKIIIKEIYGMAKVVYSAKAEKEIEHIEHNGSAHNLPVCIARSPYFSRSLTSAQVLQVRDVRLLAGAGVIQVEANDYERMPSYTGKFSIERLRNELFK